jgi:small subunit ribosomal protein S15
MARTHARVKGKSGSNRPVKADLSFVSMKKADVEKLVIKLAKDDVKPSMIGLILRDTHGVPSIKLVTGKSVSTILAEAKVESKLPEDLAALVAKALALKKHLETNTRDTHNKRGLQLIESKIRRLSTYYKKKNVIASNWSMN